MNNRPNRNILYLAGVAFVILIMAILSIAMNNQPQPPTENTNSSVNDSQHSVNQINIADKIKGYNKTVKNIPKEESASITDMLDNTLQLNNSSINQVDKIILRPNSYSQKLVDKDKAIYETTFILDIPKIKQSYKIIDRYSPLPAEKSGLVDYNVLALCLDKSEAIYDDFGCKDRMTIENGQ